MTNRHSRRSSFAVALALLTLVGCEHNSRDDVPSFGQAEVSVMALSTSAVAHVTVTITGSGISSPILVSLTASGSLWGGTIGSIPAGANRTFTLSARDSAATEIYRGEAVGIPIVSGQTTSVIINAQQVAPPASRNNAAPIIDSLVASTLTVIPGDVVSFAVTAHDPNPGDVLTYMWTASAGTFSSPSSSATTWTAPTTGTTAHITIDVRDQKNAHAKMTIDVSVDTSNGRGKASIAANLNTWPEIADVTIDPSRIDAGQSVSINVVATDPDGDALAFEWTSDCVGAFNTTVSSVAMFTLTSVPTTSVCTFTVSVQDGKGGSNSGSIAIPAGPAPQANLAPVIVSSYQSAETATAGQTVTFRVQAMDPDGSPITFTWTANQGTLGAQNNGAGTSEVVWTAPLMSGPYSVAVTVTDATGLATTETFQGTVVASPGACQGSGLTNGDFASNSAWTFAGQATYNPTEGASGPGCADLGPLAMGSITQSFCRDTTKNALQFSSWWGTTPDARVNGTIVAESLNGSGSSPWATNHLCLGDAAQVELSLSSSKFGPWEWRIDDVTEVSLEACPAPGHILNNSFDAGLTNWTVDGSVTAADGNAIISGVQCGGARLTTWASVPSSFAHPAIRLSWHGGLSGGVAYSLQAGGQALTLRQAPFDDPVSTQARLCLGSVQGLAVAVTIDARTGGMCVDTGGTLSIEEVALIDDSTCD